MLDTIISFIQLGHLISVILLVVLYFTIPMILRKYVFVQDEDEQTSIGTEETEEKQDINTDDVDDI